MWRDLSYYLQFSSACLSLLKLTKICFVHRMIGRKFAFASQKGATVQHHSPLLSRFHVAHGSFQVKYCAFTSSFVFCRSAGKSMHRSSAEEDSSSEEEMEWSGNNMLLANLSIPQLDGTADENGGK